MKIVNHTTRPVVLDLSDTDTKPGFREQLRIAPGVYTKGGRVQPVTTDVPVSYNKKVKDNPFLKALVANKELTIEATTKAGGKGTE